MRALPEKVKKILAKKTFGHLATLMPDGAPQVSAVWVDVDDDGNTILVNSAEGRLKDKNMRADRRVALSIVDPDDPYQSASIRGRIAEITTEGAEEHIDKMAKKYFGKDTYPFRKPAEKRVLYRIQPDKITTMG